MVAGSLIYQIKINKNMELLSMLKGHKSKQSFVSRIEEVFLYWSKLKGKVNVEITFFAQILCFVAF